MYHLVLFPCYRPASVNCLQYGNLENSLLCNYEPAIFFRKYMYTTNGWHVILSASNGKLGVNNATYVRPHTHTHTAPSSSHHGAAVAILQGGGGVRGLVRMVQVTPEQCVVEGTVDGLTPGQHAIQVHQYGDLSDGCAR